MEEELKRRIEIEDDIDEESEIQSEESEPSLWYTEEPKIPKKSSPEDSPTKESKEESGYTEALKLVMENNQRTMELILKASMNKAPGEADRLDQEDQRIKVVELAKLEESTEDNASITCGD